MSKLTPKQEEFAQLVVKYNNQSKARREAYNVSPDTKDETVCNDAYKLMCNPDISARVSELRKATAKEHGIDRAFIINGLLEIISDADYTFKLGKDNELSKNDSKAFYRLMNQTKNTDKLRALETLTKMLGLSEPEKIQKEVKIEIVEKQRD